MEGPATLMGRFVIGAQGDIAHITVIHQCTETNHVDASKDRLASALGTLHVQVSSVPRLSRKPFSLAATKAPSVTSVTSPSFWTLPATSTSPSHREVEKVRIERFRVAGDVPAEGGVR